MVNSASLSFALDRYTQDLEVYLVGGAVRDALLGITFSDRDWLVVGATPEMLLARGFKPVGADFPVFLHPRTQEEYALARTERKTGRGYQGFTFYTGADVRLEEDLRRRDLTINAMATDTQGKLYDPFHGRQDIQQRCLRHVSEAFAEDPVRVLRLGRFASQFNRFTIAPETRELCAQMARDGTLHDLVAERVWQEIARGLMSTDPVPMLDFLESIHAMQILLADLHYQSEIGEWLRQAAHVAFNLPQRYALLAMMSGAQLDQTLRVGNLERAYAGLLRELYPVLQSPYDWSQAVVSREQSEYLLMVMERFDAIRKPQRFLDLVQCCTVLPAFSGDTERCMAMSMRWQFSLKQIQTVNDGAIAQQHQSNVVAIKSAIREARITALME